MADDDFEFRRERMSRQEWWGLAKGALFFALLIGFLILPFHHADVLEQRPQSGPTACASVWSAGSADHRNGDPARYQERCAALRTRTVAWMVVLAVPISVMFTTWLVGVRTRDDRGPVTRSRE